MVHAGDIAGVVRIANDAISMAMRPASCHSARMTTARLFLATCLIWLLTLASPAGAGAVTMADLQTGIGDLKDNSDLVDGGLGAALLHGGIGCAANAAFDGSCASGFAVSFGTELIAGQLSANFEADPNMDARAQEAARMAFEQNRAALIGAFAGYITSGGNAVNVNQGASVARSAVANNRQLHVQEAELIGLYAGVFAREQGISVEEATALLTAETLIGISDDFAHLESDAAARAFLDGLEQAGQVVDGQTLFGQLDRGSDEYRNSTINMGDMVQTSGLLLIADQVAFNRALALSLGLRHLRSNSYGNLVVSPKVGRRLTAKNSAS